MKTILVTGSSGLIGSEVCTFFHNIGYKVYGLDNNQRSVFFGPQGDTRWNQKRLEKNLEFFEHIEIDIRDRIEKMRTQMTGSNSVPVEKERKSFKSGENLSKKNER